MKKTYFDLLDDLKKHFLGVWGTKSQSYIRHDPRQYHLYVTNKVSSTSSNGMLTIGTKVDNIPNSDSCVGIKTFGFWGYKPDNADETTPQFEIVVRKNVEEGGGFVYTLEHLLQEVDKYLDTDGRAYALEILKKMLELMHSDEYTERVSAEKVFG